MFLLSSTETVTIKTISKLYRAKFRSLIFWIYFAWPLCHNLLYSWPHSPFWNAFWDLGHHTSLVLSVLSVLRGLHFSTQMFYLSDHIHQCFYILLTGQRLTSICSQTRPLPKTYSVAYLIALSRYQKGI